MTKLSVIIPVYNASNFIERCAKSLFAQTLDSLEILFVDDCSTDDSVDKIYNVLEKYPKRKKQTKIIHMKKKSGACKTRLYALDLVSGEFVAFCDSDDYYAHDAFQKLIERACCDNADIVLFDYYLRKENTNIVRKIYDKNKKIKSDYFEDLLRMKINGALWNKVYKKKLFASPFLIPKGDVGEDFVINLQMFFRSTNIVYLDEPLYYYCFNEKSVMNCIEKDKILNRFKHNLANVLVVKNFMQENKLEKKYHNEIDLMIYYSKNWLGPLIHRDLYYKLWKYSFREINYRILFNPLLAYSTKVKHILRLFRLYRK